MIIKVLLTEIEEKSEAFKELKEAFHIPLKPLYLATKKRKISIKCLA